MASIKGPPKKKELLKAENKEPLDTSPPTSYKHLQLRVPEALKNEFKAMAASRGVGMHTLFETMFEEFKLK